MKIKYECPRCFASCASQAKYQTHLNNHFPTATVDERAKIDHVVASKMFKKMPVRNRRNPVFTGYVKSKSTRKIGSYPAADQLMAWIVVLGEVG